MYLARHRSTDSSMEYFLQQTRQLSPAGKTYLDDVCQHHDPSEDQISLSRDDVSAIFWNSRLYLCVANRARLRDPEDSELTHIFHILHKDHAKLRLLIFLAIIEHMIGKLGLGRVTMAHRMILWTYGGELYLLGLISEKFGPEGTALHAIL